MPQHTRVPWAGVKGAKGAAICFISLIFRPIKPARGATKYLQYYIIKGAANQKRMGTTDLDKRGKSFETEITKDLDYHYFT